jgi:hypothetical protein
LLGVHVLHALGDRERAPMKWHYFHNWTKRRYFYGDEKYDYAYVERNGANPKLWDVCVLRPSFGTHADSLKEAKRIVEEKVSPKRSTYR